MSRNYICDCCGVSLDDFDDDYILHTTYNGVAKDYCPYCSGKLDDSIKVTTRMTKESLRPGYPYLNEDAIEKYNDYNGKHRIRGGF